MLDRICGTCTLPAQPIQVMSFVSKVIEIYLTIHNNFYNNSTPNNMSTSCEIWNSGSANLTFFGISVPFCDIEIDGKHSDILSRTRSFISIKLVHYCHINMIGPVNACYFDFVLL